MAERGGWRKVLQDSGCFCFGCKGCSRGERSVGEEEGDEMVEYEKVTLNDEKRSLKENKEGRHTTKTQPKSEHTRKSESKELFEKLVFAGRPLVKKKVIRRFSLVESVDFLNLTFSPLSSPFLDLQYFSQAKKLLRQSGKWSFNIFIFDWLTNGRTFFHLLTHLFNEHDFFTTFNLDPLKFLHTLNLIEEGYSGSNPYHNSLHAADVVQAIHCNIIDKKVCGHLSSLEKMAAILAAACHDLDHPGVNQAFLISSNHHLVQLYEGVSVLENHHWRGALSILHQSKLFHHLNANQWKRLTYLVRLMILATDITKQHQILDTFKNRIESKNLDLADISGKDFILQITLKCADICNPCRSWKLSKMWSHLVCEEFFIQGDKEKSLNLPLTQAYDREHSTSAKIQTGFMTYVVEPLFIEWNKFSPTCRSKVMLENLNANRIIWKELEVGEGKTKLSQKTLISILDLENDHEKNACEELSCNLISVPFFIKKEKSLSCSFPKSRSKIAPLEDKENHDPSKSVEVLMGDFNGHKCINPITSSCHSSAEARRSSLPTSQLPSIVSNNFQNVDKRRASLPLSRILEDSHHDLPCTTLSPIEALSESSPSHSPTQDYPSQHTSQTPSQHFHDKASLITDPTHMESKKGSICKTVTKKPNQIKTRFSFDFGKSTKQQHSIDRSISFICSGKTLQQTQQSTQFSPKQHKNLAPSQDWPDKPFLRRSSCPNATPLYNPRKNERKPSLQVNIFNTPSLSANAQPNKLSSTSFNTNKTRNASLTVENPLIQPNKRFEERKKRANSLVSSCNVKDDNCPKSSGADTNFVFTATKAFKNNFFFKRNIFLTLESNNKEILSRVASEHIREANPILSSIRNNSIPQQSISKLPGPPFKSSPAILRCFEMVPRKGTADISVMEGDIEALPLLPKS